MLRRHFLAAFACLGCCLGWCVLGIRRRPVPITSSNSPADELQLAEMVRARILRHSPASGTTFDPITIITLVGFLLRLLQVCQEAAILRKQAIVKRNPDSFAVARIRATLHRQFIAEHPEASPARVQDYVDGALKAFAEATPDELRQMKRQLDQANHQPTELELFKLTEDLSQ